MNAVMMPIIATDDLQGVRAYYTEKLGFFEAFSLKGEDGELITVSLGAQTGAPLMFGAPMGSSPLNPDGLMLFISTEDVDAYHDEVAAHGVDITEGLTDQFWGDRTFIVRDPWGLHLQFGQTVSEMSAPPDGIQVEMTSQT